MNKTNEDVRHIDTFITEKGIKYKELWKVVVVYISEFDVFQGNKTIYHIGRTIKELQQNVDNGFDEIYVNTMIHDGSLLAELMEIFKSNKIPDNPKFPRISRTIRHYKKGKGREEMCKIMEEFAEEQRRLERERMSKVMEEFAEEQRRLERERMSKVMKEFAEKQKRIAHKQGRREGKRKGKREGKREGRYELIRVITLLQDGKVTDELKHMGYDEATINDAIKVINLTPTL